MSERIEINEQRKLLNLKSQIIWCLELKYEEIRGESK